MQADYRNFGVGSPDPPPRRRPATRPRRRLSSRELERRLTDWGQTTELGLVLRGAMLLGPARSGSLDRCLRAAAAEIAARRMRETCG